MQTERSGGFPFLPIALAMGVILGLSFPGFRLAVAVVPPLWLAFLRCALAVGVLTPLWLAERRQGPRPAPAPSPPSAARLAIFGVVTLGLPTALTMVAVVQIPAGQASVLSNTVPLWILLFAWAGVGRSRPGRPQLALGLVGFCGVALLVLPEGWGGPLLLVLLLLVEAALTGLNGDLLKQWFPDVPGTLVLVVGFSWSAALLGITAALFEPLPVAVLDPPVLATVAFLGVVSTGIIWWLWYLMLDRRSADRAAVFLYLGPVISLVLSAAFLGEMLTGVELVGIGVVLAAAFGLDLYPLLRRSMPRPARTP